MRKKNVRNGFRSIRWIRLRIVNGNEGEKSTGEHLRAKKMGNIVSGQTYPRLLHFFFLQRRAPRAEKRVLGKGERVERRERETRLRTGKTTKTTEKKQLHQRSPSRKKSNEKEPRDHTTKDMIHYFSVLHFPNKRKKNVHILCQQCAKGDSCQGRLLPDGAAV